MASLLVPSQLKARGAPKLGIAPTLLAAPGDDIRIEIDISGIEALPPKAFLRLRGVPGGASLSEGHPIAPGTWAVPLGSLSNLRLRVPTDLAGKASLHLSLVTVDGPPLAEAATALVVAPAVAAATAAPAAPAPKQPEPKTEPEAKTSAPPPAAVPPPPAAPKAATDPEAIQRAVAMKSRGEKAIAEGNIADARLLLERAAEAGLADAALLLGSTYDAAELRRLRTIGVVADPEQARHWYAVAQSLGSAEAAARLRRLAGGR